VRRTQHFLSFVNIRQYEKGALLVIPTRHAATIVDLPLDNIARIHTEAATLGRALVRGFNATGVNIFQDAGQHVPHFHVHVVPRYPGSDPTTIYQQAKFEPVSVMEQEAVAEQVRGALEDTEAT
jgi:histidine triad (HIT) family protein